MQGRIASHLSNKEKDLMEFLKFPRTPHLFVVSGLDIRDDKVLPEPEYQLFLNNNIIIEEKVDGANVGISLSKKGDLLIQNRGDRKSVV